MLRTFWHSVKNSFVLSAVLTLCAALALISTNSDWWLVLKMLSIIFISSFIVFHYVFDLE